MKLVIYPELDSARLTAVQQAAGAMPVVSCPTEETAAQELATATAFFGKLTPRLLAAARQLEWVQSPTASLEHYLFPELIAHPCMLTNMRGLFSDVIADHVLGYMLCAVRNLHLYLKRQATGVWAPVGGETERTSFATGPGWATAIDRAHRRLADCRAGIIGLGAIGSEIARRGLASGMEVCAVDPIVRELPGVVPEVWPVDQLHRLLECSDFVIIAAPHTPRTVHLIGPRELARMRPSAWLINIGRGAIVDLAALTTALQQGQIAGAALDVFEQEPLPPDHPLWRMENTILTPHIAAASERVPERHLQTLLQNIRRYVCREPLLNVVRKSEWF
jgi:phosphoglycerate dehydrogenase-like enzyme